jgi:uracil-DNA glycosylase family 4
MSPDIDWDALDRLARKHKRWRADHPELSPVYVSGEGDNPSAFIVGEAPGAQEEIRRRPFVGESGLILRSLMEIASLRSQPLMSPGKPPMSWDANCWLTNTVKFRPPGNRTPRPGEIDSVRHLLLDEWNTVGRPRIVIPVGAVALRAIMGPGWSILRVAGTHHVITNKQGEEMSIFPMIHPSMAVQEKSLRPKLEKHWETLGSYLDGELG